MAKLAPGYVSTFSVLPPAVALVATLAWCLLVAWRTARKLSCHLERAWCCRRRCHAGLAAASRRCGCLILDYGRSLAPQVAGVRAVITERRQAAWLPMA